MLLISDRLNLMSGKTLDWQEVVYSLVSTVGLVQVSIGQDTDGIG